MEEDTRATVLCTRTHNNQKSENLNKNNTHQPLPVHPSNHIRAISCPKESCVAKALSYAFYCRNEYCPPIVPSGIIFLFEFSWHVQLADAQVRVVSNDAWEELAR